MTDEYTKKLQEIAAKLMKTLFNVDTTKHEAYEYE